MTPTGFNIFTTLKPDVSKILRLLSTSACKSCSAMSKRESGNPVHDYTKPATMPYVVYPAVRDDIA